MITNSIFKSNVGTRGGSVSIINLPTRIENCIFEENFASYEAGAIFFSGRETGNEVEFPEDGIIITKT